jgi:predicted DNA-binding transcriptional regulator AlpA
VNTTTRAMIELALSSDKSISLRVAHAIRDLLNGALTPSDGGTTAPLLLTMTDAATHLGVSRVTFWRLVKKEVFQPVEITKGVFRYRKSDLDRFSDAETKYRPVIRGVTPIISLTH